MSYSLQVRGAAKKSLGHQFMHVYFPTCLFLQQERLCENKIHLTMFYNYQSKSTDIHLNWAI